jgi:hypothetical protein
MRTALSTLSVLIVVAGCSSGNGNQTGQSGSSGGGSTGTGGQCVPTGAGGTGGVGGSMYTMPAVCGQRGSATATATTYANGWEEFIITSDSGLGDVICAVRFDVKRVEVPPPAGCTECSWTQTVEYSNPRTMTDVNGVCANSDYGLNAAKIASINGSRMAIGFVREWMGAHGSVRFRYFQNKCMWDVFGTATWDEITSTNPTGDNSFEYTNSDGNCNY